MPNFDVGAGRYTLHAGSGGAVRQKRELSGVLGIAPERLRVLSYDVGGNFGTRNRVFVEFGLVLWAAGQLRRPVKYTASRSECFLSDYQGRDLVTKVELALRRDGKFLAMRATNISNVGARCVSLSPLSKGAGLITGSYDIPAATLRAMAVYTNTMPTQAYRSSGRPEVTFAIERLVDTAAAQLGFDRIALRRKNLVRPKQMPYRNAVGMLYDSGRYEENMNTAMDIADWKGFPARRREAKRRGRLAGLGFANYVESSIGAPKEQAQIRMRPEGRVDVVIGTQPAGQGHETSFAQVVSDLLGVPVERVNIISAIPMWCVSAAVPIRGARCATPPRCFPRRRTHLIQKGMRIAAQVLEIAPERVEFQDGRFASPDRNRNFDMLELAAEVADIELAGDLAEGLAVVTDNEMHEPVFPERLRHLRGRGRSGDRRGRDHPLCLRGRCRPLHQPAHRRRSDPWRHCPGARPGDVGAGLSRSGFGQPLTGSLMDYGMPRADLVPSFTTRIAEVLSPTNPLGIKAGGEGGTTAAPAVIVSAIVDALKDFGIRDVKMPATPYRIWKLIQDAKAGRGTHRTCRSAATGFGRLPNRPASLLRRHRALVPAAQQQMRQERGGEENRHSRGRQQNQSREHARDIEAIAGFGDPVASPDPAPAAPAAISATTAPINASPPAIFRPPSI